MPKQLVESKLMDFGGLERNSNKPNRSQNLNRVTNMDTHHKPGTLTLRQGYELRYTAPIDSAYERIENGEFVSFDNFFEKTAGEGTEITVQVEKGEVVAPTIGGSKITDYKFRSVMIWVRPYWNGSHWLDSWQWLNETWISKITVAPDATYKNKIEFEGYFGNLATMTIVNVTKDTSNPIAILKTKENGTDTIAWLDTWEPDWDVDDEVVVMRNYIPIKYLLQNYNVLRKEISFHRVLSRMRIGFGGKEGRIGLGIEYANRTLQISDYGYDDIDPDLLGTEFVFATVNKVIVQPYTLFGESSEGVTTTSDFQISINATAGNYPEATYYARLTGVLNGTDEILLAEASYDSPGTEKFLLKPLVKAGSLSRRLTSLKTYFSENGDDYYLVNEYVLQKDGNIIASEDWLITDEGYLTFNIVSSASDLHTEANAASSSDIDSVGSWLSINQTLYPLTTIAATNWALRLTSGTDNVLSMSFIYPLDQFSKVPNAGKVYEMSIRTIASVVGSTYIYIIGKIGGNQEARLLKVVGLSTIYTTLTFDIEIPDEFDDLSECHLKLINESLGFFSSGETVDMEFLTFTENDTQYLDEADELGTQMLVELGYQATFNLVRDWMDAIVLNGITWLVGTWIEKRRDNKIFGSFISGLTANMHDVITAQKFQDVDRYKGEVVVGIAILSNSNMVVLKDGAALIIDPDTGQIFETAVGYGAVIKNSILVIKGTVYWGSQDDIMSMGATSGYVADEISDRFVRDIYQSFTDKTNVHVVLDRYGAYRIALTDDKEGVDIPELVLTKRGWLDQVRYHHPEVYRNGLAGRVWFMNSGNIYAFPFDEEAFVGYADVYGNYNSGW